MIDWKIFAASIVALLFIATLLFGGARDGVSSFLDGVSKYLGGSPLENAEVKSISFSISPKELTITPDKTATVQNGDTVFSGFEGSITISISNKTVRLLSDTLTVSFPLEDLNISDIAIKSLSVSGTKLELKPDISTDAADIEMKSFSGGIHATPQGIEFIGTTPQLKVKIGDLQLAVV